MGLQPACAMFPFSRCVRFCWIGRPVLTLIAWLAGCGAHVDVGIVNRVGRRHPGADLEEDGVGRRAVLEMMSVRIAGAESGAVTDAKNLFAVVRDKDDFALDHV